MTQSAKKEVAKIHVDQIDPNPYQQRKDFDQGAIRELAESIKNQGLISPVSVRPHPDQDGRFQLIAGERRLRAYKYLKRTVIEAIVSEMADDQIEEVALIENVQREDLSLIEEANGYQRLLERCEGDVEKVVEKVGKSRPTVEGRIALLDLRSEVQAMVDTGQLSLEQAQVLLEVEDHEEQLKLAKAAIRARMDANRLKGLVQRKSKKTDGNGEDKAAVPVTFKRINKMLIGLADGLERLDLSKASAEELQTLKSQLEALTEQIDDDVKPAISQRLRSPDRPKTEEEEEGVDAITA